MERSILIQEDSVIDIKNFVTSCRAIVLTCSYPSTQLPPPRPTTLFRCFPDLILWESTLGSVEDGLAGGTLPWQVVDSVYPDPRTNISPTKALLKMIFLFHRWDMLVSGISRFLFFWSIFTIIGNRTSAVRMAGNPSTAVHGRKPQMHLVTKGFLTPSTSRC